MKTPEEYLLAVHSRAKRRHKQHIKALCLSCAIFLCLATGGIALHLSNLSAQSLDRSTASAQQAVTVVIQDGSGHSYPCENSLSIAGILRNLTQPSTETQADMSLEESSLEDLRPNDLTESQTDIAAGNGSPFSALEITLTAEGQTSVYCLEGTTLQNVQTGQIYTLTQDQTQSLYSLLSENIP